MKNIHLNVQNKKYPVAKPIYINLILRGTKKNETNNKANTIL